MIQTIKLPIPSVATLKQPAIPHTVALPPIAKLGKPYSVGAQVWLDVDVDETQGEISCDWGLCVSGQSRPPSGVMMDAPMIYGGRRYYLWSTCIA